MWRFKASKYKNAAPIVPKPELCVRDIIVGSYQNYGNNIAASAAFMAFNWEHAGTSVCVLPLDDCGRKSKTMPMLHAHSDTVTDLEFSPFHDGLLVTGSLDCLVKIWHIPEEGVTTSITNPECTFSVKQRRIERVGFHPTADYLMHSTAAGAVNLWDISSQEELFSNNEHPEVIQSLSWKRDGTILATTCKDKMVRVMDPRANAPITLTADNHQSIKDSRVVWLGDQDRILTTGFDSARLRQVIVRDIRNFNKPEKTLELDCSTGILMPLFDADTNMLFLAGKGDSTITYLEVTDKEPYLIEGLRHSGEQTKGACLVPKRALRVMEGEVNRVMQLTSNSVIPIMYQVPRKTYRDFHADLYPDAVGFKTDLSATQWLAGKNIPVPKMSLDPAKREAGIEPITVHRGSVKNMVANMKNNGVGASCKKSSEMIIEEQPYVPIKGRIRQMEECGGGAITKQSKNEDNWKRASATSNGLNGSNGKVQEQSKEDNQQLDDGAVLESQVDSNKVIEPRLGPKPFVTATASDNFSFDKVFAVPQVPGTLSEAEDQEEADQKTNNGTKNGSVEEVEEIAVDDKTSPSPPPVTCTSTATAILNIKKQQEEESGETVDMRTKKPPVDEVDDKDRMGPPASVVRESISIADRRKMYEMRSLSGAPGQEENKSAHASPIPLRRHNSLKQNNGEKDVADVTPPPPSPAPTSGDAIANGKRTSTVFGRVSKFRHLKGTPGHKSTQLDNVRNVSRQIPGECDGFQANHERVAVPLAGPGGKIAIYELSKTGRLPDGVIPSLVNGANIMDFQWDPFDSRRLAVACDDGTVKFWTIPEDGLKEPINTADMELVAHTDKIYLIRFHPCAKDVLLTASYDMTMKVWNVKDKERERIRLTGHTDQIFSFAWSPCGKYGATLCRDGKVRIYEPRRSIEPIAEGTGPAGTRGGRIVWAIDGEYLVVTGFDKVSERQILIYKRTNLKTPLNTLGLDVSPAILVPFYDEDSSTLFVTGKGDSTIFTFDITDEAPYICPLSHHRSATSHQGLSFLMKNQCNVMAVEFAKAYRLSNSTIECLSFTVPRLKSELFQDDLFPATRVKWSAAMSAEEWFDVNMMDRSPMRISLQPEGIATLSSSKPTTGTGTPAHTANPANNNGNGIHSGSSAGVGDPMDFNPNKAANFADSRKRQEQDLKNALSSRMEADLSEVVHDTENGVEDEEWDEN